MSIFSNLTVKLGMVGATPIIATFDGTNIWSTQSVRLSANYNRAPPGDFPRVSVEVGAAGGWTPSNGTFEESLTIASGSVVTFYLCEAAALIAAGAAS
jgi:hypothetical protein